jgi:enoyl-CoA hydratase/carnithine racemase
MSAFETLIYEKEDALALVTLNRPQFLNAYSIQMRDDLFEILNAIRNDDEVRVVLLKGSGEKAFCAGADLSEFLTAPPPVAARRIRFNRDVWGLFLSIPQPLIAVLHGYVLGSGIEMALCCDLRITADDAQFGLPEVELGIIPAAGGTQTLPRAVGRSNALDMLLTGRWLDAREALRIKLVNRIVPGDRLMKTARGMAENIAAGDPGAVKGIKQAVVRGMDLPLAQGLELEKRLACQRGL